MSHPPPPSYDDFMSLQNHRQHQSPITSFFKDKLSFFNQTGKTLVVMLVGLRGAGKSTLGNGFASLFSDVIFLESKDFVDFNCSEKTFQNISDAIRKNSQNGKKLIVLDRLISNNFDNVHQLFNSVYAANCSASLFFVKLDVGNEIAVQRVVNRENSGGRKKEIKHDDETELLSVMEKKGFLPDTMIVKTDNKNQDTVLSEFTGIMTRLVFSLTKLNDASAKAAKFA